jgi:RNA recognition motif-containing protein
MMNARLYIGNLAPEVGEEDLRSLFSQKGTVTEVKLMLDPATQRSRGFAFVTMATPEMAAAALRDFHCHPLAGRYITVTEARPPQEPKGLIGEGFDVGPSAGFRPAPQQQKSRQRSSGSSHRRGRRRGHGR